MSVPSQSHHKSTAEKGPNCILHYDAVISFWFCYLKRTYVFYSVLISDWGSVSTMTQFAISSLKGGINYFFLYMLLQLGPFFNMHLVWHAACRQKCSLRTFWLCEKQHASRNVSCEFFYYMWKTACRLQCRKQHTFIHFCTYPFKKYVN